MSCDRIEIYDLRNLEFIKEISKFYQHVREAIASEADNINFKYEKNYNILRQVYR